MCQTDVAEVAEVAENYSVIDGTGLHRTDGSGGIILSQISQVWEDSVIIT